MTRRMLKSVLKIRFGDIGNFLYDRHGSLVIRSQLREMSCFDTWLSIEERPERKAMLGRVGLGPGISCGLEKLDLKIRV